MRIKNTCFFTTMTSNSMSDHVYLEVAYGTIGNPAFCLALYLTGVHFRGELQHVSDVSEQKIKCGPFRTREIGGVRL